jgi:7-keto-8-aminopelargonate synthetase-like enzyme
MESQQAKVSCAVTYCENEDLYTICPNRHKMCLKCIQSWGLRDYTGCPLCNEESMLRLVIKMCKEHDNELKKLQTRLQRIEKEKKKSENYLREVTACCTVALKRADRLSHADEELSSEEE